MGKIGEKCRKMWGKQGANLGKIGGKWGKMWRECVENVVFPLYP